MDMMNKQENIKSPQIIIYTSPFQRCIDTSIGICRGLQQQQKIKKIPKLRMDIGLGEWMCERFFDTICPAQYLISRQQEKLARQQAYSYSILAKKRENEDTILPPLSIDYAYTNSNISEFDYPERYTDMIHRFEETRIQCLNKNSLKEGEQVVIIFVTHAVGVNALLDGFRNRVTIPLESNYCSISCVRQCNTTTTAIDASDQSDEEDDYCEYMETNSTSSLSPTKLKWFIDTVMYDKHLSL
jgi:broad specificity phosphatase PhoE